jgi:ABC-type Fe3+-hydroxamate transport system substrate-binding protein
MRYFLIFITLFNGTAFGQSPAKVERVYAAGPPASLLVFAIAPDKLTGWTRAMRPSEAAFFPEPYGQLPELGRLTGRGNTANVEVVLKAKTDLIVDVGSPANPTPRSRSRCRSRRAFPMRCSTGASSRRLPRCAQSAG